MAAGRPKSIEDNKIFDVSKPGKSKPMGTSRPVIISRGNIITDPSDVSTPLAPPSATRKVISPVSDATEPDSRDAVVKVKVGGTSKSLEESMIGAPVATAASIEVKNTALTVAPDSSKETPAPEETAPAVPAEESVAVTGREAAAETAPETSEEAAETEPVANPEPTPEEPTEETPAVNEEAPATSDSATIDALAESTTIKKAAEKELEEQAKREAELQALIDSGKYFVPLEHDSTATKNNSGIWVVLILILIAFAAYVAIDMKLVNTGINLPFHLFKQ